MQLKNFTIELGYNCNSSCEYCFQKEYSKSQSSLELSDDRILNFFYKLKNSQLLEDKINIMFFGGESLLYLDKIKNILSKLEDYQIKVQPSITTNGMLLTDKNIKELISLNIFPTISLDGAPLTQLTHRKINFVSISDFYNQIKKYLNKCKEKNIPTVCQSTITPMTIGKLTETFLLASNLGFEFWWYELEQISNLGHNQWNSITLEQYRKQIRQILQLEKISSMEILPKKCIDNYLNDKTEERINLYINTNGDIHFSSRLINRLNADTAQYFSFNNLETFNINDLKKKLAIILPFSYRTTYKQYSDCNNCLMKNFCLLNLPEELKSIQSLQDSSNCGFWKILSEEMEVIKCSHME